MMITMTTNEALAKHNFITKVLLKSGDFEVSRDLKVKIMKMRIEYSKIRKAFDEDLQEFVKGLSSEELINLQNKTDRTDEENKQLQKLIEKINEDYAAYVTERGKDNVDCTEYTFSDSEYEQIIEANVDNDTEINGTKITAPDFLDILYSLFVK